MTIFVVDAIRVREEDQWITDLRVQQADGLTQQRVGPVLEIPSHEAATRMLADDSFYPTFAVEGHKRAGPRLRYLVVSGEEGVQDADHCQEGRSLRDLPRF